MPDALTDMLDHLRRGQEAARRSAVAVTSVPDPKMPGRLAHSLEGAARGTVQNRIAELCEQAADAGGRAQFIGPHRTGRGTWAALGETIVPVAGERAA